MLVAVAREVADVEIVAELLQLDMAGSSSLGFEQLAGVALLQGAAVVEQPDMQLVGRIIHGLGGGQRISQQA